MTSAGDIRLNTNVIIHDGHAELIANSDCIVNETAEVYNGNVFIAFFDK